MTKEFCFVGRWAALVGLIFFCVGQSAAQTFVDVAISAGVDNPEANLGSAKIGPSWGDYDNDGDLDLYQAIGHGGAPSILYRNEGNETFTYVSPSAGVADTGPSSQAVWGDYDNDGDLDLYLGNNGLNRLYRNEGNGTFTDRNGIDIPGDSRNTQGAAWADFNNDGFLDLHVANFSVQDNLYQNNGDGTFFDAALSAGVDYSGGSSYGAWGDYDGDNDLDLLLANSSVPFLYRNNGDETFTEISGSVGITASGSSTGPGWADYDNDGDLDLYVAYGNTIDRMYANNGNGTFSESNGATGLGDGGTGHITTWADHDNDGDLDLYVGRISGNNLHYVNNGSGSFTESAVSLGSENGRASRGAAWGDFDNDGDLDLFVGNTGSVVRNRLYKNFSSTNHWLHVDLVGTLSNRQGIGAKITATVGAAQQSRSVDGGSSFWSQSSATVEFGLGAATTVDQLTIAWPSGTVQTLNNVAVDQLLVVTEQAALIADAGPDQVVGSAGGAVSVALDGSGSSSDGTIVRYTWTEGATVLADGNAAAAEQPTVSLGMGTHAITLEVEDDAGAIDTDQVIITVRQLLPDGTLPPSGLVSWWKGEGDFTDSWGSNDGTGFGDITFAPGIDGQALSLDGDNDAVPLGAPANLQLQDLTIAAWVKRASATLTTVFVPSFPGTVLSHGPGGYGFYMYGASASQGNGRLGFGRIASDEILATTTVIDTSWHHVAVARGNGEARFYEDGQLVQTQAYTTGFGPGPIAIGTRADAHQLSSWYGLLDEIQVYNRSLSDGEMQALYTAFTNPDVAIWAPDLTTTYNQALEVPISIDNATNIVSAEVFIEYDTALLTLAGISSTGTLTDGWSVESNTEAGSGTLETVKVAVATDQSAATGPATLVHLNFIVNDVRVPASSPLTLTHALFNDGVPGNIPQDGSVTLVGNTGTITSLPAQIIPRETVTVTVVDVDLDLDGAPGTDQVIVGIANANNGDSISLTLDEDGTTAGTFSATYDTEFGAVALVDALIQAQAGDAMVATYSDALDGAGSGPTNRTAQTDVIGGADGAVQITLVLQPGDPLYIEVTDADLNVSFSSAETVAVTVVNSRTAESFTVLLTEADLDDEVFFGSLATIPGASTATEMNSAEDDVLTVTYDDVVTAVGAQSNRTATDDVIDPWGDADDNESLQAFDAAQVLIDVLSGGTQLSANGRLAANVDIDPVATGISPFDASLILQRRVGLINTFPVQDPTSTNHPQGTAASPKLIIEQRLLSLVPSEGYLSLVADERDGIVAGDLLLAGVNGRVEMVGELASFLSASRQKKEGLHIVFAGAEAAQGPGELLRVYGVGPNRLQLVRAVFNDGQIEGVAVGMAAPSAAPTAFVLQPNMPNPFNPETTIRFALPGQSAVVLSIYDALGQQVRVLVDGVRAAGSYAAVWDGRDAMGRSVSSGVYFYELRAGDFRQLRRMLLLK